MQKRGAVDSREIGLFMDFWSLHQRGNGVERTKWEDAVFKGALESMDVWYGHAGTVSLLMSRIPAAWGEVEAGRRFEDRGWCFFERNVSSLVKVGTHVLDGGFFDAQALAAKYPSSATIGDGRFAAKDEAALARQATGEDRADQPFLASLIQCSRCGPLHPDRFPEALKSKAFSLEEDREVVETLYNKVAHGVAYATEQSESRLRKHRYDTIVEGVGIDRLTANFWWVGALRTEWQCASWLTLMRCDAQRSHCG